MRKASCTLAIVLALVVASSARAAVFTGRIDTATEIDDLKFTFAGGMFHASFDVTPDTPGEVPVSFYTLWGDEYPTKGIEGIRLEGVAYYAQDLTVPNLPAGDYRIAVQVSSFTANAQGLPDPIEPYAYRLTVDAPVAVRSANGMTLVPEPASLAGLGLAGLLLRRRR